MVVFYDLLSSNLTQTCGTLSVCFLRILQGHLVILKLVEKQMIGVKMPLKGWVGWFFAEMDEVLKLWL